LRRTSLRWRRSRRNYYSRSRRYVPPSSTSHLHFLQTPNPPSPLQTKKLETEIASTTERIQNEETKLSEVSQKTEDQKVVVQEKKNDLEEKAKQLKETQEAFERQKEKEEELRLELENLSKMFAEEKRQIEVHQKRMQNSTIAIQCFARIYFAKQRVKHRIFQVAMLKHLKEVGSVKVESVVRMFLAKRRVAYMLHEKYLAMINATALRIQCWFRVQAAIRKISFIKSKLLNARMRQQEIEEEYQRLVAAEEARKRDEEKREKERKKVEQKQKWEKEKLDRNLQFMSRDVVRRANRKIDHDPTRPSLQCIAEVIYCIKRFSDDIALQADGLMCLSKNASASAPVCHFLLDLGIAAVLQSALENIPEDFEVKGAGEELTRLLCAADDIKKAFPVAFQEDIKKLKKSESNEKVVSEATFWEHMEIQLEVIGSIDETYLVSNEDSFLDSQTSFKTNEEGFLPQPYSMSPENSSMLQSIFSEGSPQPAFDVSITLEQSPKPPEMPPRLDFGTMEEMKKSVAWKVWEEEEKKDSIEVPASGAFSHTPYALPVGGRKKAKKKKRSKKSFDTNEVNEEGQQQPLVGGKDNGENANDEKILFFEDGGQIHVQEEEEEEENEEVGEKKKDKEDSIEDREDNVWDNDSAGNGNNTAFIEKNEVILIPNPTLHKGRTSPMDFSMTSNLTNNVKDFGLWTDDRDEKSRISGPFLYNGEGGDEESKKSQQQVVLKKKKRNKKVKEGEKKPGYRKARKRDKFLSENIEEMEMEPKYPKADEEETGGPIEETAKAKKKTRSPSTGLEVLPRLEPEEWSERRKTVPIKVAGPAVDKLHKHKTVKKIFENAAPARAIVKNSYMRGVGESIGALESPGRVSPVEGRGRRHSIRDMVDIFKLLDESNSGIIAAEKFRGALLAMSSLGVKEKEVESMMDDFKVDKKKDYIDYLEFCSSGNVLRVKKYASNPAKVPFQPWVAQISRPPPLRSGHIQVTWEKHVKWYQKRREHAGIWLVKRAVEAVKWDLAQRENCRVLMHKGKQAVAICHLLDMAKPQKKHFKKQIRDAKDLRRIVTKARKHKLRQEYAHKGLKMMVRKDVVEKIMRSFQQRNYNKIYYLGYKNAVAFEYLLAIGKHSVMHYLEQQANVIWLHQFAEKAKVQYLKCVENYNWLGERSQRALKTWAKKDYTQNGLVRAGNKYIRVWEEKRLALVNLHRRGVKAVEFNAKADKCFAYLNNRGQIALGYEVRLNEAATFLAKWGFESTHHVQCQDEAKAWLREKVEGVLMIKKRQGESEGWLHQKGTHAKRHLNSCTKAREVLYKRIEQARLKTSKSVQCNLDMTMFIDDARLQVHKQMLLNQYPGLIKEMEKKIKTQDKIEEKERKNKGVDERFKVEMKDAFEYFDTDESGEIDRVEFRHLLNSGHLIEVPQDEIDDCYTQIDNDGSGGIDFEEFFKWFLYEFTHEKHHGKKEKFKVSSIVPLKQRALRKLLPKYCDGEMVDDFGELVPAPGMIVKKKGTDNRWWLDEVERAKDPYSAYKARLKRKEEGRKNNITHEEKVALRKAKEAEQRKEVEEMKKKMRARLQNNPGWEGVGEREMGLGIDREDEDEEVGSTHSSE